jgi:sugar phosphate isomerase/epimerase
MRFELSTTIGGGARLAARDLERIALNGFTTIDVSMSPGSLGPGDQRTFQDFQRGATAAGLEIGGLSAAWSLAAAAMDRVADLGATRLTLIADACRAHGIEPGAAPNAGGLSRQLDALALEAARRGLSLAVEFPRTMAPETIVDLIDAVEGGPVGVCLDVGHSHLSGGAPEAIEVLSGYVVVTHLHDNQGRDDHHRSPYAGTVDWPLTLMAFWKTGFAGAAVIELTPDPDMAAALTRAVGARTRLQAILDDLAQPMVFPE